MWGGKPTLSTFEARDRIIELIQEEHNPEVVDVGGNPMLSTFEARDRIVDTYQSS